MKPWCRVLFVETVRFCCIKMSAINSEMTHNREYQLKRYDTRWFEHILSSILFCTNLIIPKKANRVIFLKHKPSSAFMIYSYRPWCIAAFFFLFLLNAVLCTFNILTIFLKQWFDWLKLTSSGIWLVQSID